MNAEYIEISIPRNHRSLEKTEQRTARIIQDYDNFYLCETSGIRTCVRKEDVEMGRSLIDKKILVDMAIEAKSKEELVDRLKSEYGFERAQIANLVSRYQLLQHFKNDNDDNDDDRDELEIVKLPPKTTVRRLQEQTILKSSVCNYIVEKDEFTFSKRTFAYGEIDELILDLKELKQRA